jgi:hypothetical protein
MMRNDALLRHVDRIVAVERDSSMPTTIPTSPRVSRPPPVDADDDTDILVCTALTAVGLLLAVLVVNFEIDRAQASGPSSVTVMTDRMHTTVPGIL